MKTRLSEKQIRKIVRKILVERSSFTGFGGFKSTAVDDEINSSEYTDKTLNPSSMTMSDQGLEILKKMEGVRYQVYDDETGRVVSSYREVQGNPTIGVGHLIKNNEKEHFEQYLKNGSKLTESQVNDLFREDIEKHTTFKNQISVPITQNMFDAMASFSFNAGPDALKQDGIINLINRKDYQSAGEKIKSSRVSALGDPNYLSNRRSKESELFLRYLPKD